VEYLVRSHAFCVSTAYLDSTRDTGLVTGVPHDGSNQTSWESSRLIFKSRWSS